MKNILIPYDFTSFSDEAFKAAMEIGKKFDSKLTLLTIIGKDVTTSDMSWSSVQDAHDKAENKAKEDLSKIQKSNMIENVPISVEIIHNPSAADGILAFAENNNIDLIVMGSHGRSGFKKLVLGSVALEVVTKSNCRVLVAKPPKKVN